MSLNQIASAAESLTDEDVLKLDRRLHQILRDRGVGLIYDDNYGSMSDSQLLAEADAAFLAYDEAEAKAG